MSTHQAAVNTAKGQLFEVQKLDTPEPGPGEALIEVKAIALNPVDGKQRDFGFFIDGYPAVLGSDISGTILKLGSHIPLNTPFQVGSRVVAYAQTFYCGAAPRYGAFQEKVIVPIANVAPIPDALSFVEASTIPMSIVTAWAGWYTLGIPYNTRLETPSEKGVLIWGAASSVGVGAVQSAREMGYKVFATASLKHKTLLESIGASETVDYKDSEAVSKLVSAANRAGVKIKLAYQTGGDMKPILDVLSAFGGGCLAHAQAPQESDPKVDGVEVFYIHAPSDPGQRTKHFEFVMQKWLAPRLANGKFVIASKPRLIQGGLDGINTGCAILAKGGVSGEKLVVEL